MIASLSRYSSLETFPASLLEHLYASDVLPSPPIVGPRNLSYALNANVLDLQLLLH